MDRPSDPTSEKPTPAHPTGAAVALMVGVTVLIIVAAALASFDLV